MMHIINPDIDKYMRDILPDRNPVLLEMEQYAREHRFPIVGPLVGTFLYQTAAATKARSIFEMGSGFGYSSFWFAKGISDGGHIICTDGNEDNITRAREFHARGGFGNKIDYNVGDARAILKRHEGPFDIIFNDIDKEQYPEAFELALPRLRKGGLFISDNVLWGGHVLDEKPADSTQGILEFNRLLFNSPEVIASIIPIRDGLALAVKI